MLQFEPTKHGTGVTILGDYGDLNSLHQTFWNLMPTSSNVSDRERVRLISIMSYEIRHAYQHHRLCEERSYGNDDKVMYYGCQIDWICLLFSISCLRHEASYKSLGKNDLANLYLLEYWTEQTMLKFDSQGASVLKHFINARINVSDDLIFHIYQSVWREFMSMKPGKARFRKIPELIGKYSFFTSPEYKDMKARFALLTTNDGSTVCDYEDLMEDVTVIL